MNYVTKFRAFQLDTPGSLFSFYKANHYTLIEARLPSSGINSLLQDMSFHNKNTIDLLHITSWDADHCTYDDLKTILNHLRPNIIEVPHYTPVTADGILCWRLVMGYDRIHEQYVPNVRVVTKEYISGLPTAEQRGSTNVVLHSMYNCDNKNDMSLIKLFRSAGFNVLSVGDCESEDIASEIMKYSLILTEVDVLILAHHGANNGFTTGRLLDAIKPKIAICSSNYGNHFDHPRPEVCSLFQYRNIPLLTTKRGDVVVYEVEGTSSAIAVNLVSNNELEESREGFIPKKFEVTAKVA